MFSTSIAVDAIKRLNDTRSSANPIQPATLRASSQLNESPNAITKCNTVISQQCNSPRADAEHEDQQTQTPDGQECDAQLWKYHQGSQDTNNQDEGHDHNDWWQSNLAVGTTSTFFGRAGPFEKAVECVATNGRRGQHNNAQKASDGTQEVEPVNSVLHAAQDSR